MVRFPQSRVKEFRHNDATQSWGVAFYHFMGLDKLEGAAQELCAELLTCSEHRARNFVSERLDYRA